MSKTLKELKAEILEKGQGAVTEDDLKSIKTKAQAEKVLQDYENITAEPQAESIEIVPEASFPLGGIEWGKGGSMKATGATPPPAVEVASKKGYFQGRGDNLTYTDELKAVLPYLFPPPEGERYVQEKCLADMSYVFIAQVIGYPLENNPRGTPKPFVVNTKWIEEWRAQLIKQAQEQSS